MLGLVAGGLAVVQMAEFTMTRHEPVDPNSRLAVVVEANTKGYTRFSELQMTRSLFLACRLEVNANILSEAFEVVGPGSFRFVLEPALDEADERQLHGCLEDARIDQLQLEVVAMHRLAQDPASPPVGDG
ncbi:MAG: hypothetical protein KY439_00195 [Actinobacteria bacterium]|nr:hypothetical protein [Actinomycetota bacterium]